MKQKRESEALNLKKQDKEITSQEYSQLHAGTVKLKIILKFLSFKNRFLPYAKFHTVKDLRREQSKELNDFDKFIYDGKSDFFFNRKGCQIEDVFISFQPDFSVF